MSSIRQIIEQWTKTYHHIHPHNILHETEFGSVPVRKKYGIIREILHTVVIETNFSICIKTPRHTAGI